MKERWPVSPRNGSPDGQTVEVDLEEQFKQEREAFKKEKRREKILAKSPCGAGVEPTECSCENGETFTPADTTERPCDGLPSSCTCPNGETFDKEALREIFKALKAEQE